MADPVHSEAPKFEDTTLVALLDFQFNVQRSPGVVDDGVAVKLTVGAALPPPLERLQPASEIITKHAMAAAIDNRAKCFIRILLTRR